MDKPILSPMENKNSQNEKYTLFLYISNINNALFEFDFIKKSNYIEIESFDTMPETKIIFSKKIFLEEFQQSLKELDFSKDLSFTYDIIRKMTKKNFKIEKKNDKIFMEITFKYMNKIDIMKITLEEEGKNKIGNKFDNKIENKIEEQKDISNLDIRKFVQELKD